MEHILVVDDNEFSVIYLEEVIGKHYRIEHAEDGEQGVLMALESPPALILMDVEMPGISGYEACMRIKQEPATRDVPVIFVSAQVGIADRTAGYEAGGDDYVTKPFDPEELIRKIEVLLRQQQRNRELSEQAKLATSAAMTAMSSVGDTGVIMRFLSEMVSCLDFGAVAKTILETMGNFQLDVSVQLRDDKGSLSRSHQGLCSPLEENVLSNMASCARIVDLGRKSAFNYPRVTIIVHNMPKNDPEHYGRVKDNIAIIAEAIDVHLQSLGIIDQALNRGDTLLRLLQNSVRTLHDIDESYRQQRLSSSNILNDLIQKIEASFVHLGLTESQERYLQDTLRDAIDQAQALYDQELRVGESMRSLNADLDSALKQEVQALADNKVQDETRIELF